MTIIIVFSVTAILYFGFVFQLLHVEPSPLSIMLSIINSFNISSIISIILLFFQDVAYKLFGPGVLWSAIQKSYPTDEWIIQSHFRQLENNTGLRVAIMGYFEYGIGIFAMYASSLASTISSIGLLATYLPKLISVGFGISFTNLISVGFGISFTALSISLFFVFKRQVSKRGIHIYSESLINKGLSKGRIQLIIIAINISLIIVGQLAEKNFLKIFGS
jgi:hypothetical protein